MTAHTACPRPSENAIPALRLAHPARAREPADAGEPHGLFDRLFEAWAERAHRVWADRGWCRPGRAPYL